jgi:hypothetical protein
MTSKKADSGEPRNGVRASTEYLSRRPEIAEMARNLPGLIEAYREVAANNSPCAPNKSRK